MLLEGRSRNINARRRKESGTGSLFPICTLEILVFHTKKKEQGTSFRFPVPDSLFPINNFEISETFSHIRNKEPVAGSRYPVPNYQFYINRGFFHTNLTVFIICRQITFSSLVPFNALHAYEIDITRN